jgi:peptide deformylase
MVRRPKSIVVSFLDESGNEIEQDLGGFKARVFLHELDHINGRTMTHWRVSEGNIDIIEAEKNPNLMTTVDFYKDKINELRD